MNPVESKNIPYICTIIGFISDLIVKNYIKNWNWLTKNV